MQILLCTGLKIAGRNQYAVGEKLIPLDTGNKGETAVKLLMDETMEKREFEIYFQPKISLHNYKIGGSRGSGAAGEDLTVSW